MVCSDENFFINSDVKPVSGECYMAITKLNVLEEKDWECLLKTIQYFFVAQGRRGNGRGWSILHLTNPIRDPFTLTISTITTITHPFPSSKGLRMKNSSFGSTYL